jgi:hypothetical protein
MIVESRPRLIKLCINNLMDQKISMAGRKPN